MGKYETFEQFLALQKTFISPNTFIIHLALTALLAYLLGIIYNKYSHSISNRTSFSNNFVLIAVTTMIVISIVKSSLSLSLGLVGALSIVRFRTAIKNPEELSYLFYCIAIGLGLGADQTAITVLGFLFIAAVLIVKGMLKNQQTQNHNMILTLSVDGVTKIDVDKAANVLRKHCSNIELKRFDKNKKSFQASFIVDLIDFEALNQAKADLQKLESKLHISFLNNSLYE